MKLLVEGIDQATVIKEDVNGRRNYFLEGVFLQGDIKNRNGRIYPIGVLDKEAARYTNEFVNRKRAFGEFGHPSCKNATVRVLTESGWKFIPDVVVGENVYTLNTETGKTELHPVIRTIKEPYKGNMIRIKQRSFDSLSTPTHRFPVTDRYGVTSYLTAEDIKEKLPSGSLRHSFIPKGHIGLSSDTKEDSIFSGWDNHTFVCFMAMWISEGSLKKNVITISQNEGAKAEAFRAILNTSPLKWSEYTKTNRDNTLVIFSCFDKQLADYLRPLGKQHERYIPKDIISSLDSALASDFIEYYILGDGRGHTKKYGRADVFTTSAELADDLSHVAFIAGYPTRQFTETCKKDYVFADHVIKAKNKMSLHFVRFKRSRSVWLDQRCVTITEEPYDDYVYCLEVKNSNFYVMENEHTSWTGNSPQIQMERISHLITSLRKEGNNYVGRAQLIDEGYGKIARSLVEVGAVLGMSSRGVGSTNNRDGVTYVGEDFQLTTAADIVAEPSAPDAFVEGVMESSDWVKNTDGTWRRKYIAETKKNIFESKGDLQKLERVMMDSFSRLLANITRS
jgi:hypothetical protein